MEDNKKQIIEEEASSHEKKSLEPKERREQAKNQLIEFAVINNIPSLEDRVYYGLDPIGLLALKGTNEKTRQLCNKLAKNNENGNEIYQALLKMSIEIQGSGPWAYAEKFQTADDNYVKAWMILKSVNQILREKVLSPNEFCEHLDTVLAELDAAIANPEYYFENNSKKQLLEISRSRFRIAEEGVPITEMDDGFTAMALQKNKAGILQDADGMLYVGSSEPIENHIFEKWGLTASETLDRGRKVTLFKNNRGEVLAKRVHPGFIVVLSRSFHLAAEIVKAVNSPDKVGELPPNILGHMIYIPTSFKEEDEKERSAEMEIINQQIREAISLQAGGELSLENLSLQDAFYRVFCLVKSRIIFKDAIKNLQRRKQERAEKKAQKTGKPLESIEISDEEMVSMLIKIESKVAQKAEELKFIMSCLENDLNNLPTGINRVLDMAGGAGDVALAMIMSFLEKGKKLDEARIVDPFSIEFKNMTDTIIDYLPNNEDFRKTIVADTTALQEVKISEKDIVIAKHPCGTLADEIISNWINSESPLLCIMTCCQDKAKDEPAAYDISQEDWSNWCRLSSKTNSEDPAQRKEGLEAMKKLDKARVNYLKRHGFEAELITNPAFPKGDVIIARRKL